ncbi:MAG: hypothetical protein JSR97_01170 [Verrucomicrobia bacterium]|nr:hypothetical protein [Verrucomicrobiota bacterium]
MPLLKITNYQIAMVKGRCSYRFQTGGGAWTNWEPVSTPDFTAVAAIFATNNAYFDSTAGAFVAGSSGGAMLATEMALPLIAKKARTAKKRTNKPKTKNK